MRILFITAHRLGDAVLSLASLEFLRELYPTAFFTIICGVDVVDIFKNFPNCEEIIPLVKRSYNRHWFFLWRRLVLTRWTLIIDLRASLVSFGLYTKRRLVIPGGRRKFHKLEQHWSSLSVLAPKQSLSEKRPSYFLPKIWISQEDDALAARLLSEEENYIILAPTAGSEDKIWSVKFFIFLALSLIERGYKIILLYGGSARESALMYEFYMARARGDFSEETLIDLGGGKYSLTVIAAILRRVCLFIGNDSGLTHLASSFKSLPVLALFGPTLSKEYGPVSELSEVIIAPSLEGDIQDGKGIMCLLSPEKVLHKALNMLERE